MEGPSSTSAEKKEGKTKTKQKKEGEKQCSKKKKEAVSVFGNFQMPGHLDFPQLEKLKYSSTQAF